MRGPGRREIDADGAMVAPGFVDVHTHYDGQATWDSRLQPSSLHGVTTVVTGNCGVGFAPARPEHRDRLIDLMEGVEDIPGIALHEGLPWTWESFPEYLDVLGARSFDIDLAVQVPHAALRVHAMGARANAHEEATPEEVSVMARLAAEAVEAGALGFTTSRTLNHKSIDGRLTPSYGLGAAELLAIGRAVGRTGRGVLQVVTDFPDVEAEFSIIRGMAEESGRPVSFTLTQFPYDSSRHRSVVALLEEAVADGLEIRGQVAPRAIGLILGLENTLNPFMRNTVWRERVAHLPVEEQRRLMRRPEVRAAVLAAQTGEKELNRVGGGLINEYSSMYELGDPPDYEPPPSSSIADRSADPDALAYDIIAAGGMLYVVGANYIDGNLDAVRELLVHANTIPGLSDGGAHVGTICDASFTTTLLGHRDRIPLEFLVQRQTRDTARAVGLADRGVLAPGYRADLLVVDLPNLRMHRPEMHADLPAGGRRLLQRVDGYRHTVVAGRETYTDGEATGALPGRLVRGARS
ncbi:amidohydrolase family protein [Pseudonocardia halophobica]